MLPLYVGKFRRSNLFKITSDRLQLLNILQTTKNETVRVIQRFYGPRCMNITVLFHLRPLLGAETARPILKFTIVFLKQCSPGYIINWLTRQVEMGINLWPANGILEFSSAPVQFPTGFSFFSCRIAIEKARAIAVGIFTLYLCANAAKNKIQL